MKFNFKIQQYQTDAVDAVVKVFNGQGFHDKISYIRDLGKMKSADMQMTLGLTDEEMELYDPTNDTGYKNELVELSDEQLLHNIKSCLINLKMIKVIWLLIFMICLTNGTTINSKQGFTRSTKILLLQNEKQLKQSPKEPLMTN